MSSLLHAGQTLCQSLVPISPHAPLYAALVCGVNLPAGEVKSLFVDTGLIHVLVVSGAHLGVLARLARKLPRFARVILLIGYAWFTDFGAPIVRALAVVFVRPLARRRGLSPLASELAASLATLAVVPAWFTSRSFLMSWLCAIALKSPFGSTRAPALAAGARVYVLLYPFSFSAPTALAWNLALAPVLGHVMFPACLATFVVPLAFVVDRLWDATLAILKLGPRLPPEGEFLDVGWLWWTPWFVNIAAIAGEVAWRRARAFS